MPPILADNGLHAADIDYSDTARFFHAKCGPDYAWCACEAPGASVHT